MNTRKPAVAGQFYPAQHDDCLEEIQQCLEETSLEQPLPDNIVAAIVPHAGWTFSGPLAAMAFAAIKQLHEKVHTFILFGAVHSYQPSAAAVYNLGSWQTPLGETKIDEDLADQILKATTLASADLEAHRHEHSIEVQLPFIQHLFAGARIVPILVVPGSNAIELGERIGTIIAHAANKKIVCIGSTDLTHYGPRYGFYPEGTGPAAIDWAKNVNDARFITAALEAAPLEMLQTADENHNACGPGAAAATVAAAKQLGKTKGILLAHTHSNDVMNKKFNQTSNESVGYATIIY